MAIYKINESYGSEVHPEQAKIEKALLDIKGTTKVEFDYRPNDGVYKVPENHLIVLPFCRDDKLFGDGFDYFKNRKEWKNKVISTLRKLGWVQEDPMEDNDTYLYLVMKKRPTAESKVVTERWADDALAELANKPKSEWTEADWDTYNYCKNANAERDYYDSLDETINSSESAYDEIQAMRDEENEKAKRKERFQLMHKIFDKHGLADSDEKWTSDLYDLFYYAEEVRLVSNLNSIPNKTEEGQTIKYRWSVDDINIYTDAYADYVYILEPAQLTEGFRYSGTDKTSEKLTMDALNELEANPGEVYNYKKFDIFYGENKDHFPFNPCYYIKFRPSDYTSMMFSKDHCLKYINDNKLDESLIEAVSYGTYDNTALEADLLALDGVIQVDWDLKSYDELGQVIVLTKYNISNKADLTDWFIQRSDILKSILSVFKKHNLKLEDPVEDQGTWWYFVLRPNNQVASDRPTFEYMMVEFFETSGSPADDIMRRTKDIKYQDPAKLSEILVNADKIFRETDDLGGYNKVYFDNYIRYQGKLYKFHAGRVDLGDGEKAVSLPADYIKLVEDYFLDEIKASNNKIPIVEE